MPGQNIPPETSLWVVWAIKACGIFVTFVGGIVSATWIVAAKWKGFDDRISAVEKTQSDCDARSVTDLDDKLVRIHDRIDDLYRLYNGSDERGKPKHKRIS